MYHKLFAHLLVCFWREQSYGEELFLHKKSTILPLVYPLTASHTYVLELWASISTSSWQLPDL